MKIGTIFTLDDGTPMIVTRTFLEALTGGLRLTIEAASTETEAEIIARLDSKPR
jgi:hypothetical protein